jgi:predicted esterase
MLRRYYILTLFLFFLQSTVWGQQPWAYQEKYYQRMSCDADTGQQYALILPTAYKAETSYPVIIFLDPEAKGDFAVVKYRLLAQQYGIILAGSFGSRNFDGTSSEKAFVSIYNDLVKKYTVDPQHVWLAGFSGGSRAAAAIAISYPEITGVIGCGAGFADMEDESMKKLKAYVALTGDRDMNFGELLENSEWLDGLGVNNLLLLFEGGHEWPPVAQMELAVTWLTQSAKRMDPAVSTKIHARADSGILYMSWFEWRQLQKLPGWKDSAVIIANRLQAENKFASDQLFFERLMEDERKAINDFSFAFTALLKGQRPEKETWLLKADRIGLLLNDWSQYNRISGQRRFNQATSTCREYYFQLMGNKEYAKALAVAQVFLCFDTQNANGYYMLARAEAGLGNKKRSEKNLKEATKKGLAWSDRLGNDKLLLSLFTAAELKGIINAK